MIRNDISAIRHAGLRSLLHTFNHGIIDRDGLLLLSTRQVRDWTLDDASIDGVDVEATMNKRYVSELVGDLVDGTVREELMACGRAIVNVWAERIACRYPERPVIFYLGGTEEVILRFHVRRAGVDDWLDIADRQLILRSQLELYELRDQQLRTLHR